MTQSRSKCSLLEALQYPNPALTKILRGVLDIKDLRTQEELDFEHLLAHTKLMSSKAANYTFAAVEILEQLTQDIYISINLFKHGDWDTFILQDALKLLQYTLDNLFGGGDAHSGQAKGLGVAYKYCDSAQPG
jgi:hypothetical protein